MKIHYLGSISSTWLHGAQFPFNQQYNAQFIQCTISDQRKPAGAKDVHGMLMKLIPDGFSLLRVFDGRAHLNLDWKNSVTMTSPIFVSYDEVIKVWLNFVSFNDVIIGYYKYYEL